MIKKVSLFSLFILVFISACNQPAKNNQEQTNEYSEQIVAEDLPWSEKMAETVLYKYPDVWMIEGRETPKWSYTYGLVGTALQRLWEETGDDRYLNYTRKFADAMIDEEGNISDYEIEEYNIDHINPGKILFELYEQTGDDKYKTAIFTLREQLETHPRVEAGGFWHKEIYTHQMWLDGIYMGSPFYAQFGKVFDEPEAFDDVAHQILLIESKTRDEETGLLYHGWDESRQQRWADPETGTSPNFWGRAMGWYAMAIVDVLDYFPEDHAQRDDIIAVFDRMAEAIVNVQDEETGLWYQVLDQGDREGNFLEGSVTTMFAYSILKAVRNGYIDESYLEPGKKAFEGTIEYLISTNDDGTIVISPVCAVAGLGGDPYRDGSYDYYINEARRDNDPKAVGPFILASIEYENLPQE